MNANCVGARSRCFFWGKCHKAEPKWAELNSHNSCEWTSIHAHAYSHAHETSPFTHESIHIPPQANKNNVPNHILPSSFLSDYSVCLCCSFSQCIHFDLCLVSLAARHPVEIALLTDVVDAIFRLFASAAADMIVVVKHVPIWSSRVSTAPTTMDMRFACVWIMC